LPRSTILILIYLCSTDLHDQVMMLHRAQAKCLAPASNICFYCGVSLTKPPFGMGTNSGAGGEKWNQHTSMVIVMATGQTFHEACGKMWQQEVDKDSKEVITTRLLHLSNYSFIILSL